MPKKIEVPDGMAHCGKCRQVKPKDMFHRVTKNKSGVDGYCKECRKSYHQTKYDQKPRVIPPRGHRYCPHCVQILSEDNFHPNLLKKTHLLSIYCKKCVSNITYREPRRNSSKGGKQYGLNHQSLKPLERPVSTDPLKLAYCAGLFDAEGCAQIMPSNVGTPALTFSNDSEALIDYFQDTLGGKKKFHPRDKAEKGKSSRGISNGRVSIASLLNVDAACSALLPFLVLKKKQCEIILKATKLHPEGRIALHAELDPLNKKCVKIDFFIPENKKLDYLQVAAISDKDVAYLAGIIDGDGWVGFKKRTAVIQICMTKGASIYHIHNIFGGHCWLSPRPENQADALCISLRLETDAWVELLRRLSMFLVLKKKHAELTSMAIGSPPHEQARIEAELKRLTADSRMEKFTRVDGVEF